MPLAASPLALLAQLRPDPGGPLVADPGQPVQVRIPGVTAVPGGARLLDASADVTWSVTDRDGHPLRPGVDFTPDEPAGPCVRLVFPTQFGPPRSRAEVRVHATVHLFSAGEHGPGGVGAGALVRRTLPPVVVSLPVLSLDQVRALMTYVGHTLLAAPGLRPGLGRSGTPPTLDLVGLPPIPLAVSTHGRGDGAGTDAHDGHGGHGGHGGRHRPRAQGHDATDGAAVRRPWRAAFRLVADLPVLGTVATDLIGPAPAPGSSPAPAHCRHARADGEDRPGPGSTRS